VLTQVGRMQCCTSFTIQLWMLHLHQTGCMPHILLDFAVRSCGEGDKRHGQSEVVDQEHAAAVTFPLKCVRGQLQCSH